MLLHCTVRATLPAPPQAAFDLSADPARFPALFRGFGPVPGLRRIELDAPLAVGCTRRVYSTDGQQLTERVTELQRPDLHAYALNGLRPPLAWLAGDTQARWTFAPADGGCVVEWRYTFAARSALTAPLAALVLFGAMRPAMQRCLRAMAHALAQAPAAAGAQA